MAVLRGHAQTSFTKITTGPVATDLEESVGCAWVDYDDDGFLDLFVTNFGSSATNTLYHNNRDGTFSRYGLSVPRVRSYSMNGHVGALLYCASPPPIPSGPQTLAEARVGFHLSPCERE